MTTRRLRPERRFLARRSSGISRLTMFVARRGLLLPANTHLSATSRAGLRRTRDVIVRGIFSFSAPHMIVPRRFCPLPAGTPPKFALGIDSQLCRVGDIPDGIWLAVGQQSLGPGQVEPPLFVQVTHQMLATGRENRSKLFPNGLQLGDNSVQPRAR